MIELKIPGKKKIKVQNLLLDYNGTLAVDGRLIKGVGGILKELSKWVQIHIITADTFNSVQSQVKGFECTIFVLPEEMQDTGKLDYLKKLGPDHTICIGNGFNDRRMLKESIVGIAVILDEGASVEAVVAADIVCINILQALELLKYPLRMKATLRN